MTLTCSELPIKLSGETLIAAVDLTDRLASGETLSGTPTVTEATSGLTLSSKVVNSTTTTINGEGVAVGKAVLFVVAGGTAGTEYEIAVSVTTSSSQIVAENVGLKVI